MNASRRTRLWVALLLASLLGLAWGFSSNLSKPGDLTPLFGLWGLVGTALSLSALTTEWALRIWRRRSANV